jgi:hypothetical protein
MDRIAYCEQTAARLAAMRDELSRRAFPEAATRGAALEIEETRKRHAAVLERIAATLDKVDALRASTAPRWDAEKRDIDRELAAIDELRRSL